MKRIHRHGLAAALAIMAVPALAQSFSESFTFLKAVRERDGTTATSIVRNPSSSAIHARDRDTGEGALHILVRGRDLNWLSFLLSHGARPDLQNSDGTTPLGRASMLGWTEGAAQLRARGASVDLANSRGETPLILAVQQRHLPIVRLLLAKGANPNLTDNVAGYSALDYARRDRRSAAILRLLEEAPESRNSATMGPTPR